MDNPFVDKLLTLVPLEEKEIFTLRSAIASPMNVAANVDLLREGDCPRSFFVMIEGWAYRYKILPTGSRQIVGFIVPGDFCDLQIGLLTETDHSIRTLTLSKVATIDRAEMDAMLDQFPKVARAMYQSQLIDASVMRAWIASMGRRSSLERIAHLICALYLHAEKVGLIVEPVFTLPLSQIQLADALGMTAVNLNRIIKELRVAGVMKFSRGVIEVLDPERLARIAGFGENYLYRGRGLH